MEGDGIAPLLRIKLQHKTDEEFYHAAHQVACNLVDREYLIYEPGIVDRATGRTVADGLVFTQQTLDLPSEWRYLAGGIGKMVALAAAAVVTANQLLDLWGRLANVLP